MSDPVGREELHHRRIDMRGFRRDDGLFEVEGQVLDTKPVDFVPARGTGGHVPAGCPIHDLGVRLVFDREMVIQAVETFTRAAPYSICLGGGLALQALKGVRIGAGFTKAVRERLARPDSCTHLVELLGPMATTAIQAMSWVRRGEPEAVDAEGRPRQIDTCYAYSAERSLVAEHWPQFHIDKRSPR